MDTIYAWCEKNTRKSGKNCSKEALASCCQTSSNQRIRARYKEPKYKRSHSQKLVPRPYLWDAS